MDPLPTITPTVGPLALQVIEASGLATTAQWLTIITGIVIAVAALMAFLLQRARYYREIRPILEVHNAHVDGNFDHAKYTSLIIWFSVTNVSDNPVKKLFPSDIALHVEESTWLNG